MGKKCKFCSVEEEETHTQMKTEFTITTKMNLNQEEIWIAMLCAWGFSQKDQEVVTGLDVNRKIKPITATLCTKLHGANAGNMAFHAQKAGFKLDGTLNGEDIFSDVMKLKILKIDPEVEFRFPIGGKKKAA